jgi:hypothetical protein
MFEETKHLVTDLPGELYDICLTPSDRWIAITKYDHRQSLSFNGKTVSLPERLRFPQVAAIDEETVLVVNSRAFRDEKNAWIITDSGTINSNFYAGDAIQDVIVTENFLVTTYFDESALGSNGIERNGVAVFDLEGNYQFGYHELFSTDSVDIADCYCACWIAKDRILFFPYTEFPLVSFDLKTQTQQIWETPPEVAGSDALSSAGPVVFFYGPYEDKTGIYKWTIGDSHVEKVYEGRRHARGVSSHTRGLSNGLFLRIDETGYTIISPA